LRVVLQGYPTTVAKEIPARANIVEIGCAGGTAWFGARYHMTGVDLSLEALTLAAQDYDHVVQANATHMPLRSSSFDAVISSCVFEHFDQTSKSMLLSECHRLLKHRGKLVFFYDIWTENPLISFYRRRRPDLYKSLFLDGDGHIGYMTLESNRKCFEDSGFEIVREVYHERTPMVGNSVWKKLAQWPGAMGRLAGVCELMTTGYGRLPGLVAIAVIDASIGQLFPPRYARCVTTVAIKK
jgi:SAM-dependent methyltransferase